MPAQQRLAAVGKAAVGQATDLVLPLSPELNASGETEPEQAPSTPTQSAKLRAFMSKAQTLPDRQNRGTPESHWDRVLTAAKEYARVLTMPDTDAMELHMAAADETVGIYTGLYEAVHSS